VLVNGVLPAVAPHDSLAFVLVNTMGFFGCGINIFGVLMAVLYANAFDIDVLIKRTLVYAALTAMVVGLYVLVVGYFGALFRTPNNVVISLIATALAAIVFQPLRGLHTMHERARELGGNCAITRGPSGGTTIQVRLPMAAASTALPTSAQEPGQPEQERTLAPDVSLVRQED
jgi:hypothetical protein